ncbi:MAG: response regulator transcription factor, partial [Acidimicrobiales bacterium]
AFRYEGYNVQVAEDGGQALATFGEMAPDLLVLDVNMPVLDGLAVCRTLRSRGDRTPVLLLTARVEVSDRVDGLDAGADDYLPKPFALDELMARVRALLRRTTYDNPGEELVVDDLRLTPASRRASRRGVDIELTKTEYDLLELLMENAGIVLTRDVIYDRIWGYDFETTSRSLDVYVSYLRRKTEINEAPRLIHTVRGVGFTLRSA